jgi:hypothetical protein
MGTPLPAHLCSWGKVGRKGVLHSLVSWDVEELDLKKDDY